MTGKLVDIVGRLLSSEGNCLRVLDFCQREKLIVHFYCTLDYFIFVCIMTLRKKRKGLRH